MRVVFLFEVGFDHIAVGLLGACVFTFVFHRY